jgi:hypothetical protein
MPRSGPYTIRFGSISYDVVANLNTVRKALSRLAHVRSGSVRQESRHHCGGWRCHI